MQKKYYYSEKGGKKRCEKQLVWVWSQVSIEIYTYILWFDIQFHKMYLKPPTSCELKTFILLCEYDRIMG